MSFAQSSSSFSSSASSTQPPVFPSATARLPVLPPHTVRLQLHVPDVETPIRVNADCLQEIYDEMREKLHNKHPSVILPETSDFTTVSPYVLGDRTLLTEAQLQLLAKDTHVWLLPLCIMIKVPGRQEPTWCDAYSMAGIGADLDLSDGVMWSITPPTVATLSSPHIIHSWSELASLRHPITLFAVWDWCPVPLELQRIISPHIDAKGGTCNICQRRLTHHSHLAPFAPFVHGQ
jgi:hypothetical protein